MSFWSRADVVIRTAVFATVAAGAISAVAFDNVPLGAVVGVGTGILAAFLMWSRKRKTNERQ